MNIGIIGGGSIGLLISNYLGFNHNVTIYVKNEQQKERLNRTGIKLDGNLVYTPIQALLSSELKNEDCFIVCVKQTHIAGVLPVLAAVNQSTPLIFLQNGMAHLDQLASIRQPILLGVVDHGALKTNDHSVTHTGKGSIRMVAYTNSEEQLNKLVAALHQSDFPVFKEKDWSQLLVGKLIINTVINPITALFGVKNGEIISNRHINSLAKALCQEAVLILGLDFQEQWGRIQQVANNTARNTSSMLKDMEEKRETELDAITGYLIGRNKKHLIPNTLFVYNSVKALEVKNGIID